MTHQSCFADVVEGRLRGSVSQGIRRFVGIPYAAPPVGLNRFKTPQSVPHWEGERDATIAGPTSPQSVPEVPGIDLSPSFAPGWIEGGDYLTLNVWRPDDNRDNLPVLFYIHGGGFINGSKDISIIDGSAFARDGVLSIAINYRLGIEGFLPIPGVPSNLGLRDQIAALQWVQRNVRSFGGDPENVTVSGESAGAISVYCLLSSPFAKGLFRRAIMQSGFSACRELSAAHKVVGRMAKILKVSPDLAGFSQVSHRQAIKAQNRMAFAFIDLRNSDGVEPAYAVTRFLPVYGDDIVPEKPQDAIAKGAASNVDLLICSCREEFNNISVPLQFHRWMFPRLARLILGWFHPKGTEALKAYGLGQRGKNSGSVLSETLTDLTFRWQSRLLAESHRGTAHVMEFDWRSPAFGGRLGAAHGNVVPFIFDTLPALTGSNRVLGANPPQSLADRYHDIWVRFVKGNAMEWPAFDAKTRAVYTLVNGVAEHEPPMPAAKFV